MSKPTLQTYITDITNGCAYLDQLISDQSTDTQRINEVIQGIEYQLAITIVAESSEDLSSFASSVENAKNYLSTI
jgi:hypothetical protein